MGVLEDVLLGAADGDVSEAATLALVGVAAASSAWALSRSETEPADAVSGSPPPLLASTDGANQLVAIGVDLGDEGEPRGVSRLLFRPILPRSDLIQLRLRVPLGLLIEESGDIIGVTGCLPGDTYSALGQVMEGDLIRAVTSYRDVVTGAPMWRQMTSYTPVGTVQRKRLIFKTEGATYADVRDAIASHRADAGGDGCVLLVIERRVENDSPLAPRVGSVRREPLLDVVRRDLQQPVGKGVGDELDALGPAERARRLLGDGSGADGNERSADEREALRLPPKTD
jgi:hypothetical protein